MTEICLQIFALDEAYLCECFNKKRKCFAEKFHFKVFLEWSKEKMKHVRAVQIIMQIQFIQWCYNCSSSAIWVLMRIRLNFSCMPRTNEQIVSHVMKLLPFQWTFFFLIITWVHIIKLFFSLVSQKGIMLPITKRQWKTLYSAETSRLCAYYDINGCMISLLISHYFS